MIKKMLVMFSLTALAAIAGEKICSPYFELISLPLEYKVSSARILQSKIESINARSIIIPAKEEARSSDMALDSNIAWAKSNSCQLLLIGSLTRLGESVQFSAKLLNVDNKNILFNKLYKANDPEDLDPIFGQVATALNDPKFVAQQSIYDVTTADAARLKQKRSNSHYAFGVGYLGFPAEADNTFGFSAAMVWDARKFLGEIDFSSFAIANENGSSLTSFGLNLYRPLSDIENTLYVGGGTGLGLFGHETCEQDSWGEYCTTDIETTLLLQGSVGYMIGRASDFNARFQGDLKTGLTTIDGQIPIGIGFRVILGFDY